MRSVACCFLALMWTVLSTNCVWGSCGDHLTHQHKPSSQFEIALHLGDLPEPAPVSPCSIGKCKGNRPLTPTASIFPGNVDQFGYLQATVCILKSGHFNRFSSWDLYPPIAPQIDLVLPPPRDVV